MSITPLLRCDDLQRTQIFYESLGFNAQLNAPLLTLQGYGATLLFTDGDLWQRATGCSGTFYFTVDDVDNCFAELQRHAEISWPVQDMPYGSREFGLLDCNGYHLAFQQRR